MSALTPIASSTTSNITLARRLVVRLIGAAIVATAVFAGQSAVLASSTAVQPASQYCQWFSLPPLPTPPPIDSKHPILTGPSDGAGVF
jgi:hypothetical protein